MMSMHAALNITPNRTQQLGLDFPYDWSNQGMSDDTLVAKVLERARFMDVSRVCAYFGLPKIKQIANQFEIPLNTGVLGSFMTSIERAQQQAFAR